MWGREVDGLTLTFHLAGINNQNFLMRDEQTGTYWQQISGRAVSGPLAGKQLTLIPSDELTLALWKTEQPAGMVMKDVPAYVDGYNAKDWDVKMKSTPTVLDFPEHGLANRDLMLGVTAFGESRAFPYTRVLAEELVADRVGSAEIILLVGPDNQSVRAFRATIPAAASTADVPLEFFRTPDGMMIDSQTGSRWNFKGCALDGKSAGVCLERIEAIKDYWFDWRQYHPGTTIYTGSGHAQACVFTQHAGDVADAVKASKPGLWGDFTHAVAGTYEDLNNWANNAVSAVSSIAQGNDPVDRALTPYVDAGVQKGIDNLPAPLKDAVSTGTGDLLESLGSTAKQIQQAEPIFRAGVACSSMVAADTLAPLPAVLLGATLCPSRCAC